MYNISKEQDRRADRRADTINYSQCSFDTEKQNKTTDTRTTADIIDDRTFNMKMA